MAKTTTRAPRWAKQPQPLRTTTTTNTPPLSSSIRKVLVPKKNRLAVYSYLFKEGVIVAPKNIVIEHQAIGVPNLQVVKMMISLKSRGYVRENFNWAHHYFYLTDAGIEYLRSYLHLPADIIPATLKKPAPVARPAREGGDAKEGAFKRRDDGYRREGGEAFGRGRGF